MKRTILALLHLTTAGQLLLAQPAEAITFNFNWRSDAEGLRAEGELHIATGMVDINVNPGEDFTQADITNIDITVTDRVKSFNLSAIER